MNVKLALIVRAAFCACARGLFFVGEPAQPALDSAKAITQYVHDAWQAEAGLPDNAVWTMVQTRDGYLWLGTSNGLVRFDGVRFSVFSSANTSALKSDEIRSLVVSRDGSLWIASYGGGITHLKDGRFTSLTKKEGLPSDVVYNLFEDGQGTLWAATAEGLARWKDGRFTTYTMHEGLPNNRVYVVRGDRSGALWVGTVGGGLSRFRDGRFTNYGKKDGLRSDFVLSILQDRAGVLWVGTYGGGLATLKNGRFTSLTTRDGLTDDRVTDLWEDRDGSLWVGTYDGGLNRLRNGRFTSFTEREGLTDNSVMRLSETRDGSLWVGTRFGGLNRLRDGKLTPYTSREGLSNDMTYAVYQDPAGRMWIGTEGGGLNRFENGVFSSYTMAHGLPNDNVVSLMSDGEGGLWAGTVGGGVSRLKDGKFTTYTTREGLSSNTVYAIQRDRSGAMWFGTQDVGVTRFKGGKFTVYNERDGLGRGGVRVIAEDRLGDLWFGTNGGGLSRLRDGKFVTYTTRDGLAGDIVFSLLEDRSGTLWVGTKGSGLSRFKDGHFKTFTTRDGLADNSVFHVLEDEGGNLWLCGNRGITRVTGKSLTDVAEGRGVRLGVLSFSRSDGMKSAQCNGGSQPGAWKTTDGRLWFPTSRGLVVVDPKRLPIDERTPSVHLERTLVDGHDVPAADQVRLPPGTKSIEFHYTGIGSLSPDDLTFRYRLEGFDSEWVDAGTRRVAYYTNVPAGTYRFHVVASNKDGVENRLGAFFSFELDPFFYQSWWFRVICGAALLLVGGYGHRLRVRRLQVREQELSALVAERTRELEQANERMERLTKLDSLTGIANRRHFDEVIDVEWRRARRALGPVSIVLVDIDFFKRYNDANGHLKGDECIRQVAVVLQRVATRAGTLVARYGGEEFVVLLPAVDFTGATVVAEQLRAAVESLAIPHEHSDVACVVTISAGVAAGNPTTTESPAALLAAADKALYRSKHCGRNRVSHA